MFARATLVLVLLGGLALGPAAEAGRRDRLGLEPPDLGRQGPDGLVDRRLRMTPAQAAREAQSRYGGGRVLSVDPADGGYHVKLERRGDIRVIFIPDR